ncbi:biliverdin-producing heme oxygenase [Salinimonas lutimaris]|uniref:biliverdin-producing heme oxygenase n=1 Tax=Salinimonas lutimaris TaxID=914153 RepID=UPI0010C09BF8|nr:biliverdin-producing heme oxygenase [Salinimonas lutimaris]
MNNLLSELKRGTSESHTLLEATYPFNTLMDKTQFSTQAYQHNLMILASFHHAVLQYIAKNPISGTIEDMLNGPAIIEALKQDLAEMGGVTQLPRFLSLPSPAHPSDTAACSYVWMGSSMGARQILKWLEHPEYAHLPTRYYQQMGRCGSQWARFRAQDIWQALTCTKQQTRCISTANLLFTGLRETAVALTTGHPA